MPLNIAMKHIIIDQNGRYRYRRRVPKSAVAFVGKSEFVKVLGKTESEALSNYGEVHRHCTHLFALAKDGVNAPSPLDQQERLIALLSKWDADPFSSGRSDDEIEWRNIHADNILGKYPQSKTTGQPIGVSNEDSILVGALLSGVNSEKPEVTITDAFTFYLKENALDNPFKLQKQLARFRRVESWLLKVIREDRALSGITKEDARKLRDARLASGVSISTVRREFNDIKAVFNCAISELDVVMSNPFVRLKMPRETVSRQKKREPLDAKVIEAVYRDLRDNRLLLQVWTLLDLTGARLAEIAGLRCKDFILDADIPHILIRPSADRSLKNSWSERDVPLVVEALNIAHDIVSKGPSEGYAFGKYGPVKAHNNLGVALAKRIRKHTTNPKHVTHSLRHNMKDRLRDADVRTETSKAIQGHALSDGEDASYGNGISLSRKLEALLKATS